MEYWYGQRNAAAAYKVIEEMRSRGVVIAPYVDQHMVEDIYRVGAASHKVKMVCTA